MAVNAQGDVFLAWAKYSTWKTGHGVLAISAQRSTDGGSSWTNNVGWGVFQIGVNNPDNQGNPYFFLKDYKVRVNCFPQFAVDNSPGQNQGSLYVLWSSASTGTPSHAEIYMRKATRYSDGTISWSTNYSTPIYSDSGFDTWMPVPSVSPDGTLSALFYRSGPQGTDPISTRFGTLSGSQWTWSWMDQTGFSVASAPSTVYLGDFIGLTTWFNKAYGLWCHYGGTSAGRQAYFDSLAPPSATVQGFQIVSIDQTDAQGTSFGSIGRWYQGNFSNYSAGTNVLFDMNNGEVLRASQATKQNPSQKYWTWDQSNNVVNHRVVLPTTHPNKVAAGFQPITTSVTILAALGDGPSAIGGTIQYRDPWFIDYSDPSYGNNPRNRGMDNAVFWSRNVGTSGFVPDGSTQYPEGTYQGVFQNQNPTFQTGIPNYSVAASLSQTIAGVNSVFYHWSGDVSKVTFQDSTSTSTGVVFKQAGAVASALYKGNMRTSRSDLTDAKNQRRIGSTTIGSTPVWYAFYESMGDVWFTLSWDGGQTWDSETRLNVSPGQACNPTVSNSLSAGKIMVGWVEYNGSSYDLHLQTLTLNSPIWYGWNPSVHTRSSDNHRNLSSICSYAGSPRSDSRPVLWLELTGSSPTLVYAFERAGSGVAGGHLDMTSDLVNAVPRTEAPFTYYLNISTRTDDSNPVIVSYPASSGFSARKCFYFIGGGYAAGRRIVQYDYATRQTSLVSGGYSDYTYWSLQAATNLMCASFALVAEVGDAQGNRSVDYFTKPTYYGNSLPSLGTNFVGMSKPTVMVEQNSVFGNPTAEFAMLSTNGIWYKSTGSNLDSVGRTIAGTFEREQIGSGDRAVLHCRNNSTPARFVRYSGIGPLLKSSGELPINVVAAREWKDQAGRAGTSMFDFSGSRIVIIDSLQSGSIMCAAAVVVPSTDQLIVKRGDSVLIPSEVQIVRAGHTVRSFAPSIWNSLNVSSLPGFQAGDILEFLLPSSWERTMSYSIISLRNDSLRKAGASGQSADIALRDHHADFVAYPNPFNPSTKLSFVLPLSGRVQIKVYDIMGREIATLADGPFDAGYNSIEWGTNSNKKIVSSGVYFAHIDASDLNGQKLLSKTLKLLLVR